MSAADFASIQATARTFSSPSGDGEETDGDDTKIPGPSGLNVEQLELDHELSTVNESLVLLGESPLKRQKFSQKRYVRFKEDSKGSEVNAQKAKENAA